MMIIYISGIQNIPGELIEAAKIDGANTEADSEECDNSDGYAINYDLYLPDFDKLL